MAILARVDSFIATRLGSLQSRNEDLGLHPVGVAPGKPNCAIAEGLVTKNQNITCTTAAARMSQLTEDE